jgi:hypothetical protein
MIDWLGSMDPSAETVIRKEARVPIKEADEAAMLLRRLLDLLPPAGVKDRTARNLIEGAALGLAALAGEDGGDGIFEQMEPFL